MNSLNRNQWIAILMAILGVIMVSTTQLNELIGVNATKSLQALAGLLNSVLGGVLAAVTGQASIIKDAQAMPGVEAITVNAQANPTLAALAVDDANPKIAPAPGAGPAVAESAKSA